MWKKRKLVGYFGWAAAGIIAFDYCSDITPLVCKVDPTCRHMTNDEIALAKPIFGSKIIYSDVQIFERPSLLGFIIDLAALSYSRGAGYGRSIYLPNSTFLQKYRDEQVLSDADNFKGFRDRRTLVHELTHTAQNHSSFPYDKKEEGYLFHLTPGKLFTAYGQEQQAEIVATYYVFTRDFERLAKSLKNGESGNRIRHKSMMLQFCRDLRVYADVIQSVLPVTLPKACQKPSLS